ncbi:MAG: hypothetical protein Q9220_000847 [cf. Caloplaca sp. 1 TL-2023]
MTVMRIVNSCCALLASLLLLSVGYRKYWLDVDDPNKCRALLSRGHWLDPPSKSYVSRPFQYWQPPGCMMHEYTRKDIKTCLGGQRIVYIGDSSVRQLFWATAKKINASGADGEMREAGRHKDLSFEEDGVTVDFIWDPYLNSSSLRGELLSYLDDELQAEKTDIGAGGLVTIGGGLWFARHFESDSLHHFRNSIDYISPLLGSQQGSASTPHAAPLSKINPNGHHIYITPVQIPHYEILSPLRASAIMPAKINSMNEHLFNLSMTKRVKVAWSHTLMTWESDSTYEESGLHVIESVATRRVDVLLNMRCNAEMTRTQKQYLRALASNDLFRAFGTLGLILLYCFATDRTQLFNKVQKHFSYHDFFLLSTITLILGILSIRRSSAVTSLGRYSATNLPSKDHPLLSRDQTDEWKGWMQLLILIYHYTGASKVLWIYEIIRILVASYLFMTGFGHTTFFYRKNDYSLKRFASVIVRLNMLSCLLPYAMRTDYPFYYFAPLVSFWYIVVYLTMRIGHSSNASTSFLMGKIAASMVLVTYLIKAPIFFEGLFQILKITCRIDWDVKEWRFRLQLDRYIVYIGMLAAILYCKCTDLLHSQRFSHNNRAHFVRRYWGTIRASAIILAAVILPGFIAFARHFQDKYDYNHWVPYISAFPITSFVILRNSNRYFRNYHSSIFAWIGRCSLETFTLQFHIWLAGDTKGLLSLGIFGRKETYTDGRSQDLVVLTVIFLWLSWLAADATGKISTWIVDPAGSRRPVDQEHPQLPSTNDIESESRYKTVTGEHSLVGSWVTVARLIQSIWMERLGVRLIAILLMMWVFNLFCS